MALPPPPVKCPTAVLDLDDFLLREVFLRLPALPSLVRAALACRTFLRAVRSSPAFCRRFQALHPFPFVGLFIERFINGFEPEDSYFDAHHLPTDRDFTAVVRGGDFDLTDLPFPEDFEDSDEEDENNEKENMEEDSHEEDNNNEENITDEDTDEEDDNSEDEKEDEEEDENSEDEEEDDEATSHVLPTTLLRWHCISSPRRNFEFHIISSQEDPGVPPRLVVCFYTDFDEAVVGLISSDSSIKSEWRKFHETVIGLTGKMVNGSIYWTHFTKMDVLPLLAERQDDRECAFVLGNTKDGRPCLVSPDMWGDCSLNVFSWRRDECIGDGLNYWILDQTFPLKTIRQFIKFSKGDDEFIILRLMQLIDGVVYLRTAYDVYTEAPPLLLSFYYHKPIHPYIMAWPPSLVIDKGPCSKGQALCTPGSEGSDVKA
ncbi:hypothetical protein VPH35_134527 [Triticum aestivum]